MLSLRILPRGINHYFKQSQQFYTFVRLSSTNDSSSSSSSSDSDSDEKDNSLKKKAVLTTTDRLKVLEENKSVNVFQTIENLNKVQSVKKEVNAQTKEDSNKNLNISSKSEKSSINKQLLEVLSSVEKDVNSQTMEGRDKSLNSLSSNINYHKAFSDKKKQVNTNEFYTKKMQVAIKPKETRFNKSSKTLNKKNFEDELRTAAKDVAKTLGGDTNQTEIELLDKLFQSRTDKTTSTENSSSIRDIILAMNYENEKEVHKPNIPIKKERVPRNATEYQKEANYPMPRRENRHILKTTNLGIWSKNLSVQKIESDPQLLTWEAMEEKEIKLALETVPQNYFQELIMWTEEGKLWHFPINNEQGMDEEEKIHFSEHVFMERHLKDWCPKRGPIRHFMELVCTGLSKNPYMTVEEKIGHITWYKDYFEDKKDLLQELGVLDNKAASSLSSEDQKQIEA